MADPVDRHLVLILDKAIQSFPWESLPILRGHSVSRVPSLSFLLDRLRMRPHFGAVDPQRAFFVLNPAGDLKNTQKTFEPLLRAQEKRHGWRGVIGRPPLEVEMRDGLSSSDVFLCVSMLLGAWLTAQLLRPRWRRAVPPLDLDPPARTLRRRPALGLLVRHVARSRRLRGRRYAQQLHDRRIVRAMREGVS